MIHREIIQSGLMMTRSDGATLIGEYEKTVYDNRVDLGPTRWFIEHLDGRREPTTPLTFLISCPAKKMPWWRRYLS